MECCIASTIGFAWFLFGVCMLNASATISLIMLNVSIFLCCVYMSFVEGFSFTYKPVSNFFWPTVRIEHGYIALALFCACTLKVMVFAIQIYL